MPKHNHFNWWYQFRALSLIYLYLHSVHPPFCWGIESLTKFSKTGEGLTGPQLLQGVGGKEGVAIFSIKDKLKSDIFDDKKIL